MTTLVNAMPIPTKWNVKIFFNNMRAMRHQRFIGLTNLGATCYMNSILQQIFMIPAFRYNLLCIEDHYADEAKKEDVGNAAGEKIFDNLLFQL